jgi:hypothetical protein
MSYERLINKNTQPSDADMVAVITAPLAEGWTELRRFIEETYEIEPVLQFGGPRYGWNLPYRKGGRPLCELYPEHGSFTVLVILGKKELDLALERLESFGALVQKMLVETPRFHDGCWMYTRLADPETVQQDVQDIEQLILIKKKPPKKRQGTGEKG